MVTEATRQRINRHKSLFRNVYANLLRPWKKVANIVTTFSCEYLSIRTDIVRTFFSRVIPLSSSSFIDVSLYDKLNSTIGQRRTTVMLRRKRKRKNQSTSLINALIFATINNFKRSVIYLGETIAISDRKIYNINEEVDDESSIIDSAKKKRGILSDQQIVRLPSSL